MADFIETLKKAGILPEDHGFEGADDIVSSLKSALIERADLVKKHSDAKDGKATDGPDPTANASAPATQAAQPAASSPNDLETARWLQEKGKIVRKDGNGPWESADPNFAKLAQSLNDSEVQQQRETDRVLKTLADPNKFTNEYLGESLDALIAEKMAAFTKPLEQKFAEYETRFVSQPTAEEKYYETHKAEFEDTNSPRSKAYNEIYQELETQWKQQGILASATADEFSKALHDMSATKTDILMLQGKPDKAAGDVTGDPPPSPEAGSTSTDDRSLIERVTDGDGVEESGTRNNGSARQLNEHAHQTGDESQPRTTQGRTDFMALAKESADQLGIKI
jgi:hypothetical protein